MPRTPNLPLRKFEDLLVARVPAALGRAHGADGVGGEGGGVDGVEDGADGTHKKAAVEGVGEDEGVEEEGGGKLRRLEGDGAAGLEVHCLWYKGRSE